LRWLFAGGLQTIFLQRRLDAAPFGDGPAFRGIFGFNYFGILCLWLWRHTIYLSKLPGLVRKVRVAFDGRWTSFSAKKFARFHDLLRVPDFHRREHHKQWSDCYGQSRQTAEVQPLLLN